jgi:hypothetical protein
VTRRARSELKSSGAAVCSESVELWRISEGDCLSLAIDLLDALDSKFAEVVNDLAHEDLGGRGSRCHSDRALPFDPLSLDLILMIDEIARDAFAFAELS